MDIVIIGTGNVATVLGKKILQAKHRVVQVWGRNLPAAQKLARALRARATNTGLQIEPADIYLVAVADEAISEIAKLIHVPGKVVAHTAASVSKDVLKSMSHHYGVFYPLQSLRKDVKTIPVIPVCIDGSDSITIKMLRKLAASISSERIIVADDDERLKLHIAAVIVSNFTNHLYALADEFCEIEGLDFKKLIPLIKETTGRLDTNSPANVQTGPAIRDDEKTIRHHVSVLHKHPSLQKIYKVITGSIRAGKL